MKTKSDLIKNLDSFFKNKNEKIFLVTGVWGVGKTYQVMNDWIKNKKNAKNKCKIISLFGCEKLDDLSWNLLIELPENKNKKIKGGINELLKFVSSLLNKFAGINLSFNSFFNYIINNYPDIDTKNKIIIVDDIERKSDNIKLKDILNWVESIKNNYKKIVLIMDDTKLNDEDRDYLDKYYEKIIDRNYEISTVNEIAVKNILKDLDEKYYDLLEIKEIKNLRTLEKFNNFIKLLKNNATDDIEIYYLKLKLYLFSYRFLKNGDFTIEDYISSFYNEFAGFVRNMYNKSEIEIMKEDEERNKEIIFRYSHYPRERLLADNVRDKSLFNKVLDIEKYLKNAIEYVDSGNLEKFNEMKLKFDSCPLKEYFDYETITNLDELVKYIEKIKKSLNNKEYNPVSVIMQFIIVCVNNSEVVLDNLNTCEKEIDEILLELVKLISENKYKYECFNGLQYIQPNNEMLKKIFHRINNEYENIVLQYIENNIELDNFDYDYLNNLLSPYKTYMGSLKLCNDSDRYEKTMKLMIKRIFKDCNGNMSFTKYGICFYSIIDFHFPIEIREKLLNYATEFGYKR